MDLFTPCVPPDKLHDLFKRIVCGLFDPEHDILNQWAEGFVDRDHKFVTEFQTTFDSSFWELYLFACFKELGFAVDFAHPSPDFSVTSATSTFVGEATIASNPEGAAPASDREAQAATIANLDEDAFLNLASTRLANAISTKHAKYRCDYSKMPHVRGKPFVICVAPFEQPFFYFQGDIAIRRVLYRHDKPLVAKQDSDAIPTIVGSPQVSKTFKPSGAPVSFGYFAEPAMPEVSAVIFSSLATWGKVRALSTNLAHHTSFAVSRYAKESTAPHEAIIKKADYTESLLDGLHLFLNPFATIPLVTAPFENREIAIHTIEPDSGEYRLSMSDGFLYQRTVQSFPVTNDPKAFVENISPTKGKKYKKISAPTLPEGELIEFGGTAGNYCDFHLAHYCGWTVLVLRDTTDNTWISQAIKGAQYTVTQFTAAYDGTGLELAEWQHNKDLAFQAIKVLIDGANKSVG
jgi:hypothetical protein